MRHRTIALAAAALLAAPIIASCTTPPGPGGPTTTQPGGEGGIPGPAAGQRDCGTINKSDPVTAAERETASCFLSYHVFAGIYLKIVEGTNTIVFSAQAHTVTITRATGDTVTKRTVCSGGNSQFSLDASGNLRSSCPF
jgi:hypothetical protein